VRIRYVPALVALAIGMPCFAQANAQVDELLSEQQARLDSAAYLVLVAGGQLAEDSSPAEAYAMLQDKKWIPAGLEASAPIRIDDYCALVMKALAIRGGLMYSLFPGPRYAYRELAAKGIVNQSGGPSRSLPGDEAMQILRQALDLKGGGQ